MWRSQTVGFCTSGGKVRKGSQSWWGCRLFIRHTEEQVDVPTCLFWRVAPASCFMCWSFFLTLRPLHVAEDLNVRCAEFSRTSQSWGRPQLSRMLSASCQGQLLGHGHGDGWFVCLRHRMLGDSSVETVLYLLLNSSGTDNLNTSLLWMHPVFFWRNLCKGFVL